MTVTCISEAIHFRPYSSAQAWSTIPFPKLWEWTLPLFPVSGVPGLLLAEHSYPWVFPPLPRLVWQTPKTLRCCTLVQTLSLYIFGQVRAFLPLGLCFVNNRMGNWIKWVLRFLCCNIQQVPHYSNLTLQTVRCCSKQFHCIKRWSNSAFILSVNSLGTCLLIVKVEVSHRLFHRRYWTFFYFDSFGQRPELNNGF